MFSQDDVVKVPTGALFREGEGWAVFVVVDGHAQKRQLRLGKRHGLEAVVEQGLAPGEQVIVYPSDSVRDGAGVVVRDNDAAERPV